jgi:Fe-S cluster assembly protein SufD
MATVLAANLDERDAVAADFARVAAGLPGARLPWLARIRRDALDRFVAAGLPTTREEEWKYTNVGALARQPYTVTGTDAPMPDVAVETFTFGLDAHRVVFVDGRFAPALSRIGALPVGCVVASLADVLARDDGELEAVLGANAQHTIFSALNAAFMADGLYVRLPRNAVLDVPVHALFVTTRDDVVTQARNVVIAEPGAQALVIEHHVAGGATRYFTNAVTQLLAQPNSALTHVKLQQEGVRAYHVAGVHATQAAASRFASHSIALGAALSRADITTGFDAEGCEAELTGLYLAGGRQHVDHHTRIDHAKPHGTSREYYKGVLDDGARGVFNGKVVVHPGAQKTDAHLANHNLLLSKSAEIDTKPELRIDADDVKCAHGATVGQLDEAALFYLRSRAIDAGTARALLTYAFAHDVIERIRVAPLRGALEQVLFARLPQGGRLRELNQPT